MVTGGFKDRSSGYLDTTETLIDGPRKKWNVHQSPEIMRAGLQIQSLNNDLLLFGRNFNSFHFH